jgi:hypothetical protein
MKTTIDIADALLREAKRLAHRRNLTLRALIEQALREELDRARPQAVPPALELRTFKGQGLQPGLSWDDWSSLRDLAYEGRG